MKPKQKCLQNVVNRLMITLLLSVGFPVICALFFPIFVFLILPVTSLVGYGAKSYRCLYFYWLGAAASWTVLLALILPWMKKEKKGKDKGLPKEVSSDIDLKKLSSRGSRDVLEETEEELGSRKASTSRDAEKENASPEKERASPEKERASPEKERASPEKERASPEKERASPEKEKASPEKEKASPDNDNFRNRLASVETEATIHHSPIDIVQKDRKMTEENISHRLDIKEYSDSMESDEYIPSLGKNDFMNDEFSAETVIAKSSYTQKVQSFTISEETYECSLPSPVVVSPDAKNKNAVFLFVNNDDM